MSTSLGAYLLFVSVPGTTGGTVGSVLSEYVPGSVPVVCLSSGYYWRHCGVGLE